MTKRKTLLAGMALALGMSTAACGGSGDSPSADGGGGGSEKLEVFSWWTSGSESAALEVLSKKFQADSDAEFVNAAVSGGGGGNARQVLATRLQGGDPPDSWQLHPDKDLFTAVEDGTVADISNLYSDNGWEDVIPQAVLDMLSVDGKYYAVPVNAHRANVLWTNPGLLEDNGITWDDSTTQDQFMADTQSLTDAGVTPLCLGDKDVFASAQLLETMIMGRIGADGWNELFDGSRSFDDPDVTQAVEDFVTLLDQANSDHSAITWDQAAVNVAQGKCAATLMGDWAYGELLNKGFKENEDFGYVSMPGTVDIFDFVGDAFVKPAENVPNADAEDVWLAGLLDTQVQADFNLAKGSTPLRSDVDMSTFPPYQQQAAEDFQSKSIVSSLAHFEVANSEFCQAYADAVTALSGDGNVDSFISSMVSSQENTLG